MIITGARDKNVFGFSDHVLLNVFFMRCVGECVRNLFRFLAKNKSVCSAKIIWLCYYFLLKRFCDLASCKQACGHRLSIE
jgi:hypothetical protein